MATNPSVWRFFPQTAKAVMLAFRAGNTQLKQGVNEKRGVDEKVAKFAFSFFSLLNAEES